jgi:anaerobic magnesium-protoporphyrin IX monomethyl ester cyclase
MECGSDGAGRSVGSAGPEAGPSRGPCEKLRQEDPGGDLSTHGQAGVEERIGFKTALVRVPASYRCWQRQPALGLASLCAYLKAGGLECRVFDAHYHSWTTYDLVRRIIDYRPHLVGFGAMTHEIHESARVAERLKSEISVPVVVGGSHATALPRRTLAEFPVFDYGINGEGERPLLGLAEWFRDNRRNTKEMTASIGLDRNGVIVYARPSAKYIDGVVHRERDGVTINARPPAFSAGKIDALPFPDFDDYYGIRPDALKAPKAFCPLMATRGTANGNPFAVPVLGREVRWRSPENIHREMERAVCRWGAHTFDFCDEVLVQDAEEPRNLLRLLARERLPEHVRWSGAARAGQVPDDLVDLAKQAGCFRLRVDIGSGDDGILHTIHKGVTVDRVKREIGVMKAAGIEVEVFFTLGHPGETEEEIRRTAALAVDLNPASVGINIMVPYPGTAIYEMALRGAGGLTGLSADWSRYAWYGGRIVDNDGLPYGRLAAWRRRALVGFYLKNKRPLDLVRYLWVRRSALGFILARKSGIRLVARERFTG